jgi:hypothetical protein
MVLHHCHPIPTQAGPWAKVFCVLWQPYDSPPSCSFLLHFPHIVAYDRQSWHNQDFICSFHGELSYTLIRFLEVTLIFEPNTDVTSTSLEMPTSYNRAPKRCTVHLRGELCCTLVAGPIQTSVSLSELRCWTGVCVTYIKSCNDLAHRLLGTRSCAVLVSDRILGDATKGWDCPTMPCACRWHSVSPAVWPCMQIATMPGHWVTWIRHQTRVYAYILGKRADIGQMSYGMSSSVVLKEQPTPQRTPHANVAGGVGRIQASGLCVTRKTPLLYSKLAEWSWRTSDGESAWMGRYMASTVCFYVISSAVQYRFVDDPVRHLCTLTAFSSVDGLICGPVYIEWFCFRRRNHSWMTSRDLPTS